MNTTLISGLEVLTFVAEAGHLVRSSEVSRALNLTRAKAYRILKSLEAAGFILQDAESKAFRPSIKLWQLGTHVIVGVDLVTAARPVLSELAQQTRETVHLCIFDRMEVIFVEKSDSSDATSILTHVGARRPAYCVATGKAILSQMNFAQVRKQLPTLRAYTDLTITDPTKLFEDLARARRCGYAINRGEYRKSIWGIAAPINTSDKTVLAAVGLSAPDYRMAVEAHRISLAEYVCDAANQISNQVASSSRKIA